MVLMIFPCAARSSRPFESPDSASAEQPAGNQIDRVGRCNRRERHNRASPKRAAECPRTGGRSRAFPCSRRQTSRNVTTCVRPPCTLRSPVAHPGSVCRPPSRSAGCTQGCVRCVVGLLATPAPGKFRDFLRSDSSFAEEPVLLKARRIFSGLPPPRRASSQVLVSHGESGHRGNGDPARASDSGLRERQFARPAQLNSRIRNRRITRLSCRAPSSNLSPWPE